MKDPEFRIVTMFEGYDREGVDTLLEQVRQLRRMRRTYGLADWVWGATFTPTRFVRGYHQDDVDTYIEELVAELEAENPSPPTRNRRLPYGTPDFRTARRSVGYHKADVEALLAEVWVRRALGSTAGLVELIRGARLGVARLGGGYRRDDVDDHLDALVADLGGPLPGPSDTR